MHEKKKRGHRWRAASQSVYKFGREERVQLAYEAILPTKEIKLKGECDVKSETCSNWPVRQSIK